MDVQVALFQPLGVDAVFLGVDAYPSDCQLCALLHHIAQRAGNGDLAGTVVHDLHLDGQGLAAYAGPCQTVGDAHGVSAVEEVRLDDAGTQQFLQHGGSHRHALHLTGSDLAGALAQHAGDGTLQITHTGLAGVAVDDAVECALVHGDLAGQAAGLKLLGQQVLAGNIVFFHAGIAGQLDDVHAVPERAGDAAQIIGGGNKEHMAQIKRDINEMIVEGAVLLRVQRLQQSCRRVAPEVPCQLVDLVQQHQGVGGLGGDHGADDLAGHSTYVGTAVAANLGFVPHAAQTDAHIFAAKAFGDGARNTGLANARRAYQTDDLCLHVRCQLAHGQHFQNAVLDLFQAVVVPIQNLLGAVDIQIIHGHGVPRQIQTGIQIGTDDRGFLITALHPGQAVYLLEQLFLAVLGKVKLPDLAAVIIGLGVGIVPFAQFVVDDVQLLVQVVIALVLVHGLVDLFRDLLFDLHHLTFAAQHLHKALQTAVEGVLVHHSLLVLIAEQEVCRHILGEEHGIIAGNDGEHHVLGKARVHTQILVKAGLEGAEQRLGLHSLFGLCSTYRSRAHGRQQKIAGGIQLGQLGAVLTLHQHLDQLVRHAQHLLDLSYYAVGVQVLLSGLTGLHLLLGNQKYVGVVGHGPLHGGNALFPPDFKMNKVVGEHHQPAQCDGGQMELLPLDLDGNFFRHIQTPPDCRSSSHAAAALSFGVFLIKIQLFPYYTDFRPKCNCPAEMVGHSGRFSWVLKPILPSAGSSARRVTEVSAPMTSPSTSMTGA